MPALGRRTGRRRALVAVLCCLGAGFALLQCPNTARPAVVALSAKELSPPRPSQPRVDSCEDAAAAGYASFHKVYDRWEAAATARRLVRNFAQVATAIEDKSLLIFDQSLEHSHDCQPQRTVLQERMRKATWKMCLAQEEIAQQLVTQDLRNRLLAAMRRRRAPLRVQEKIDILQSAVAWYQQMLQSICPAWAPLHEVDQAGVERRLGELQWSIEESKEGAELLRLAKQKQMEQLTRKRAHGLSASIDPGLRVMLRPRGLGNLQVFLNGPIGPPGHTIAMNVGILNDGSIADVYREHPVPPKLNVQPALKFNVNLR